MVLLADTGSILSSCLQSVVLRSRLSRYGYSANDMRLKQPVANCEKRKQICNFFATLT